MDVLLKKLKNPRPKKTALTPARSALTPVRIPPDPRPATPDPGPQPPDPVVPFRSYQAPVHADHTTGLLILHWSRQIGKSYTLANWAVHRLAEKLRTHPEWLITVLSNSRDNGAEFCRKATLACRAQNTPCEHADQSPDLAYASLRMEIRLTRTIAGVAHTGRIKVLAANPRTARGFSGDLILDEFAFHEDSNAIWEAAEPILAANPEYLCRVASTGNGKHNMFYRMASGLGPNDGTYFTSPAGFTVSRVTRTAAHTMGVLIYDQNTRQPVTPEAARAQALDKRAYDQNYECKYNDENMCLLSREIVQAATRGGPPIDEQSWSAATLHRLGHASGTLHLGQDVGRHRDLSVQIVLEKIGPAKRVIGILRMAGLRLPDQQRELEKICRLPAFRAGCIDMTGLGLGLVEYAQEQPWGRTRLHGLNFASTEEINTHLRAEGRRTEKARVTENLATALLAAFEDRTLEFHVELDNHTIDDLRKPERLTTPGGRTSIAAVRDEAGHADHFWALALALRAAAQIETPPGASRAYIFEQTRQSQSLAHRRDRSAAG